MTNTAGFIFARGGSKSIPRKNLVLLNGKPLIAYAIECALKCPSLTDVIVSTDDEEIAEISKKFGAHVPYLRPKNLAEDATPEILAWRHAINEYQKSKKLDVFVSFPPTSPFRNVDDMEACIQLLLNSDADIVVTAQKTDRNPYFNMITLDENQNASLVIKPEKPIHRRQDAPTVYDMTTVGYAARPDYILKTDRVLNGKVKAVLVPQKRALDIDSPFDLKLAEFILKEGNHEIHQ